MPNRLCNININPESIERIFKGNQICLLSNTQQGYVGDIFCVHMNKDTKYFRILDIWITPKEFALKFLWRLCGEISNEKLNKQFETLENQKINTTTIFAHIYSQISRDEIQNLVKT